MKDSDVDQLKYLLKSIREDTQKFISICQSRMTSRDYEEFRENTIRYLNPLLDSNSLWKDYRSNIMSLDQVIDVVKDFSPLGNLHTDTDYNYEEDESDSVIGA